MTYEDADKNALTAIVGKNQMRGDSIRRLVGNTFMAIIGEEHKGKIGDIRIGTILGFEIDSEATCMLTTVGKFSLFNNNVFYPSGEFQCTDAKGHGTVHFKFPPVGSQNI